MVARLGGEEFVIILPEPNKQTASSLVRNLLTEIRALNIAHEHSKCSDRVTMSFGIVSIIPEPDDAIKIVNVADQALYMAKKKGRDQYYA